MPLSSFDTPLKTSESLWLEGLEAPMDRIYACNTVCKIDVPQSV